MRATMHVGNGRLLELAEELEEIHEMEVSRDGTRRGYNQGHVIHPCGSPACAWGYYAIGTPRSDRLLQEAKEDGPGTWRYLIKRGDQAGQELVYAALPQSESEFALSVYESNLLFESDGCNGARNGKEAAQFIRGFVAARRAYMGDTDE